MANYHHGDLRRELLAEAARIAAESGPDALTLRELARRAGVSHAAPVHHFPTRRDLMTALATEGFALLSAALTEAGGDIYHHGVTYVTWALAHPGHYAVMWTPRLTDEEDSSLAAARMATWGILERAVADARTDASDDEEAHDSAYAAFAIVHGLAGIWLSGATPLPPDPDSRARAIVRHLAFETL